MTRLPLVRHYTPITRRSQLRWVPPMALCWALCLGCSDTVHVRLQSRDCENSGIPDVMSLLVELTRDDHMTSFHIPCKNTRGLLSNLDELEQLLGTFPPFEDVPLGGSWNLWVIGRNTPCDENAGTITLLCGKAESIEIPSPGGEIIVPVDCEDRISDFQRIQKIKEQIKSCKNGISPWVDP